jgi:transcriptional regulator with XRE-family HTH domain
LGDRRSYILTRVENRGRFAALLRDARARAGLSQRQVAARAGVPQSMVSTYERGIREPTLPTLSRLLRASGFQLQTQLAPVGPDLERNGRVLLDVLGLADAIPHRRRGPLQFPHLPKPKVVVR